MLASGGPVDAEGRVVWPVVIVAGQAPVQHEGAVDRTWPTGPTL